MIPVISVVGKSGSGKTTLLEKLIPEIKKRGYKVATIKHDAHRFEMDKPGKDTYRHFHAGADAIMISSREKMAMIARTYGEEMALDDLVKKLPPVDIVLTEGYKSGDKPKIEVHRKELNRGLLCTADELICVATDEPLDIDAPCIDINDAVSIVDLIEEKFLKKGEAS
ncbi:MAG: molybdopterin-guanine dinucleotide biosynthesis protein B [Thermoanaerobacteraceae bacterium]|nr:molybdopterin-guanine dinucleotide biosynthesis protein B [Thermoanaerobacteraceae bacterium]